MNAKSEPHLKKSSCPYCGDAQANHTLFYIENLISSLIDPHMYWVVRYTPNFIKNFADWFQSFTFRSFAFVGLASFSSDIERANTFRSKVIWEEAKKRGIQMEQLILFKKPIDYYRAKAEKTRNGQKKYIYFHSIPLLPKDMEAEHDWDDKFILKEKFTKENIPTPFFLKIPVLESNNKKNLDKIFSKFDKPVIVKPKVGSRGRHTTTNINTLPELERAIEVARVISPFLVIEEHLKGYVCRATLVQGELMGFYRGEAAYVEGDGIKTIKELIEERNAKRPERVEEIQIGRETEDFISRFGYKADDILKKGENLPLSHRVGRLFGGHTREMLDELHPSFVPILEHAAKVTGLAVLGFDCIIPDPSKDAGSQKWGIIECNTLPFIDLHYYALEGKPQNIAGRIWDFWN